MYEHNCVAIGQSAAELIPQVPRTQNTTDIHKLWKASHTNQLFEPKYFTRQLCKKDAWNLSLCLQNLCYDTTKTHTQVIRDQIKAPA